MDYKGPLSRFTGNYRTLEKKVLAMKKSWDDVEKLLSNTGPRKKKSEDNKDKK